MKKAVLETIDDAMYSITGKIETQYFIVHNLYDKVDNLEKQVNNLTYIMGGILMVLIVIIVMLWGVQ